jgi:hypothetical protein
LRLISLRWLPGPRCTVRPAPREGQPELIVGNAQHMRNVPGRKTGARKTGARKTGAKDAE